MFLIQPVLNSQGGDLHEIDEVSSEDCGAVFESDGCDAHVKRADSELGGFQAVKDVGGICAPWKTCPSLQVGKAVLELSIGADATIQLPMWLNFSEPAFKHLLRSDDREKAVIDVRQLHAISQPKSRSTFPNEFGVVIGVEEEHSELRNRRGSPDHATLRRDERLRQNVHGLPCCRTIVSKPFLEQHGRQAVPVSRPWRHTSRLGTRWEELNFRGPSYSNFNSQASTCQPAFQERGCAFRGKAGHSDITSSGL